MLKFIYTILFLLFILIAIGLITALPRKPDKNDETIDLHKNDRIVLGILLASIVVVAIIVIPIIIHLQSRSPYPSSITSVSSTPPLKIADTSGDILTLCNPGAVGAGRNERCIEYMSPQGEIYPIWLPRNVTKALKDN